MLNVHNAGGFSLLDHLGYELDHYGTVDPADLIARIDDAAPPSATTTSPPVGRRTASVGTADASFTVTTSGDGRQ